MPMHPDPKVKLQQLADGAPNKRNRSAQFPDDGLTAHAVHTGNDGGNVIDQQHGAAIGAAMLESLAAGELKIVSVDPPSYADPAQLESLVALVTAGTAKVTKVVTSQIAEAGKPRTKSVTNFLTGAPVPSVTVVYGLP
jgi:hypothetical protein